MNELLKRGVKRCFYRKKNKALKKYGKKDKKNL